MNYEIKLETDFEDYYDNLLSNKGIVYNRFKKSVATRGENLRMLESLGVPVIPFGPSRNFKYKINRCVIYTDLRSHDERGKLICHSREIDYNFQNYFASPFIEGTNGYSLRFLQVGSRRFQIVMNNPDFNNSLKSGDIVSVNEMSPQFNSVINCPIFSIDYIGISNGTMVAIDFNEVQSLKAMGFERFMTSEEVVNELIKFFNRV